MPCLSAYAWIGSSWITAFRKCCMLSGKFLELSYWCIKRSRLYLAYNLCPGRQIKYTLPQSVSQDQMMLCTSDYSPFRLCRLIRVIRKLMFNSAGNSLPATDHTSMLYIKFLRRDSQVDHLPWTISRFYSLMMAMIVILRCGDVETNPGPQTSKLTLHCVGVSKICDLFVVKTLFHEMEQL